MLPRAGALSPRRPRDALHSQAGTSSRKRAFCVRSRCRSCRTMWRFQRAAGTPGSLGSLGPAMAALRLHRALPPPKEARPGRGGAPRGLRDVRGRVAAGNPRIVLRVVLRGRMERKCGGEPPQALDHPDPTKTLT